MALNFVSQHTDSKLLIINLLVNAFGKEHITPNFFTECKGSTSLVNGIVKQEKISFMNYILEHLFPVLNIDFLVAAIFYEKMDIVKSLMLEYDIDCNLEIAKRKETLYDCALSSHCAEIIEWFEENGAIVSNNSILTAIRRGSTQRLKTYLQRLNEYNIDINEFVEGKSLLIEAVEKTNLIWSKCY